MRWYGKLLGFIAGALLFRPNPLFGAVVGLLIGHAFDSDWFRLNKENPYRELGLTSEATDAEIEEACRIANVHSIITDPAKLRDGYDTVVDVQVPSGGQKRLIALARCLLRKPEVLLLDEPTENIDADQRARLTGVIREYARDRTCIVISHDMDFIAAVADRILVLEHGRIAQVGDHQTLMAEGGLYKRLYEAQNVDPDLVYPKSHQFG